VNQLLELLLILVAVQGLEEARVPIRVEQPLTRQTREHLALEIVSLPVVEYLAVEHEESGVDPVLPQEGLLLEGEDPSILFQIQRPILRGKRNARDRRQAVVGVVESDDLRQRDVGKTVAIGGEKPLRTCRQP
jgi:hypothetical protein